MMGMKLLKVASKPFVVLFQKSELELKSAFKRKHYKLISKDVYVFRSKSVNKLDYFSIVDLFA